MAGKLNIMNTEAIQLHKHNEQVQKLDVEVALIQQDLNFIKEVHMKNLDDKIEKVDKKVDKIEQKTWWVLGLLIASIVGPFIGTMITSMMQ